MASFQYFAVILFSLLILRLITLNEVRAAPTGGLQLDRSAFRMSFGKRSPAAAAESDSSELNNANIAIPLMYDMSEAETTMEQQQQPRHKVFPSGGVGRAPWPSRWKASLFSKRLDRNLYNIGFGR
ncbi:hypothetical protein GPALN_011376 [Globodera pallida]|nr:hypothetical protein GPALN_011376 [Globodera pallida]